MVRPNEDIRRAMGAKGVKQWKVAKAINMNEGNFSRKLRKELSEEEKQHLLKIIAELEEN